MAKEWAARENHEVWVIEVQQELQEAIKKCEPLEQSIADKESELTEAHQSAHDAQAEAQGAFQEIQEARKIPVSKAFSMHSR